VNGKPDAGIGLLSMPVCFTTADAVESGAW
jgi:hypothetical protein